MRKLLGRIPVILGTVVLSAGGALLRLRQLNMGFDAVGLPSGEGLGALAVLCVAALALFALVAVQKEKKSSFAENFGASLPAVILAVPAAGLLLAGNLMALMEQSPMATPMSQMLTRVTSILGIVTALCFVGAAAGQYQKKKASAAVYLLPVVYYILQMIFNFKGWSTDPVILDYCFKLFALIAVMLAVFHVGGFALDMGKRRISVFFCLTGVFFSAVSLVDGGMTHMLVTAGSMLWMLACGWQLLGEIEEEK